VTSEELKRLCLADCTEAQREAITHMNGPLLVLAGPGSGKTRVITRRIGHLVASGIEPGRILAITFTNKASAEMRERVEDMGAASGAWISTFHSFCARFLRRYARCVGRTASFTIYDTADSAAAVKRAIEALHLDTSVYRPGRVARRISAAKNRLDGPRAVAAYRAEDSREIARIYERYEEILRSANAVDFDDLLVMMVRLFREAPEVAERLRARFDYVLVDEYQDTNHAQYLVANYLASGHRNLCVTGDPDQSIYGWRGADISNILEFERDYPDVKVVRLEQNFRSTPSILAAADAVIRKNATRKAKALWTKNPEGEPVSILRASDEEEEAYLIAGDISRRIRREGALPRDAAVFYRLNAQSRVLEKAFRGETLAYTIVAGTEFYQRAEVKDLMAYLRLVVNPRDEVSAQRVVNVPPRKVGGVSVRRLRAWAETNGLGLPDAFARAREAGVSGGALKGIAGFLDVLEVLRGMPASPVAAIVDKLIQLTGFEKYVRAQEKGEERQANVRELVNAAAEYDRAEPEGSLAGFLEQAALVSDTDRWDATRGSVTLMTLHAAKGLEFPLVYIVGLEDGLLPLVGNDGEHDVEEERRLFFVGVTRAKRKVTLSFAESRARYGRRAHTEPSRFLSELPDEVIDGRPELAAPPRWLREVEMRKRMKTRAGGFRRVRRSETEEVIYDGEMPLMPDAPFRPGDIVLHGTYGRGKVLNVVGYGDNVRAKVKFHGLGVKLLILKHARLRKID